MLLHFHDESARCSRVLVPGPPNEQLQKYRSQVNAFLRQPVIHPASIRLLYRGGDDPRCLELLQTVRQDVSGNAFTRSLEVFKCPVAANHQIADDQQGPSISKHLE